MPILDGGGPEHEVDGREPNCEFHELEVGFVYQIHPHTIRQARQHQTTGERLYKILSDGLGGAIQFHLVKSPGCVAKMITLIEGRMIPMGGPSWEDILAYAMDVSSTDAMVQAHIRNCAYCREAVKWERNRFPNFSELVP